MVKWIEVYGCAECPELSGSPVSAHDCWCDRVDREIDCDLVLDETYIPDWCPLEDLKEE
jgi:hypothetical protein